MNMDLYKFFSLNEYRKIAVIVAHPDDETLWVGGTMLVNPRADWSIHCLCRKSDPVRSVRFDNALKMFRAAGVMGDVYDGPNQLPDSGEVEKEIREIFPGEEYDVVITHSPFGEYTRHARHEEVSRAVIKLFREGYFSARELWMFAYEDGGKKYLPRAIEQADVVYDLPQDVFEIKYKMITDIFGFTADEYEALVCPKKEAFWRFEKVEEIDKHFSGL